MLANPKYIILITFISLIARVVPKDVPSNCRSLTTCESCSGHAGCSWCATTTSPSNFSCSQASLCPESLTQFCGKTPSTGLDGYVHSVSIIPDALDLYWKPVSPDDTRISFAMTCKCTGWFSVAWSPDGQMLDSDAIIGSIDPSTQKPELAAYKLPEDAAPTEGSNPSLMLYDISGSVSGGISTIMFTRDISSGFLPLNKSQMIIGAYHPTSREMVYHETYRSKQPIVRSFIGSEISADVPGAMTQGPVTLKDIHGLAMVAAWLFLTIGVLFARYTRWTENAVWFHVHQILQYIGFIMSIGGVILGLVMTKSHFKAGYHGILGIVITTLSVAQVTWAIFRPSPPIKGHPKTLSRKLFELFHWWVGRTLLILVVVQIYSGIEIVGYDLMIAYGVFVGIIIFFVAVAEILSCIFPKCGVVSCFGNCCECACPTKEVVVDVAAIHVVIP